MHCVVTMVQTFQPFQVMVQNEPIQWLVLVWDKISVLQSLCTILFENKGLFEKVSHVLTHKPILQASDALDSKLILLSLVSIDNNQYLQTIKKTGFISPLCTCLLKCQTSKITHTNGK
eukprot:c12840_g1_i2 orf=23-376(-)